MSKYAVLFGRLLCFELYIYNGTIHGKKLFSTINHLKLIMQSDWYDWYDSMIGISAVIRNM